MPKNKLPLLVIGPLLAAYLKARVLLAAAALLALAGLAACERADGAPGPAAGVSSVHLTLHPAGAQPGPDGPAFDGLLWDLGVHRGLLSYPVPVLPGDEIVGWTLTLRRDSFGPLGPTAGARLERLPAGAVAVEHVGMGATNGTQQVGPIVLAVRVDPPFEVPDDGAGYALQLGGDGVEGDRAGVATVIVNR